MAGSRTKARRNARAIRDADGLPVGYRKTRIWREVQWQIAAGITFGLPAAWATSRIVEALLFDVTPLDIRSYGLAIVVLVGVAAGAALRPMLRAASLSPADVTPVARRGGARRIRTLITPRRPPVLGRAPRFLCSRMAGFHRWSPQGTVTDAVARPPTHPA